MSWNNYDGSVQNEGGYMDTTMETNGQSGDKENVKRGNNCIPVMIGHLNKHGENLKVWGTSPKMITFLGIVLKCEQASTKINYEFKDDTGMYLFCFYSPIAENKLLSTSYFSHQVSSKELSGWKKKQTLNPE